MTRVEDLHAGNRDLHARLEYLQSLQRPSAIRSEDLAALRKQILELGASLANLPPDTRSKAEIDNEICRYRSVLERLQQCLPVLYNRLLAEKARLGIAVEHLQAATAWATAGQNSSPPNSEVRSIAGRRYFK